MKNPVRLLIAAAVLASAPVVAQAQNLKVCVVDLIQLYEKHYKTEEQLGKVRAEEQKATEELERLNKEGNALVEQFKEYQEQVTNPASTPEAKQKAQEAAQAKYEEIRKKQQEVQVFQANTQKFLQQRVSNIMSVQIEDISKIAVEIAKAKGATMLIDKSGRSVTGINLLTYVDPAFDITEDVLAEINKGLPATAPAAAAPAAPSASGSGEPSITVPGAK